MILAPVPPGALTYIGRCRLCSALILTMDGHTHMKWHAKNQHAAATTPAVSDVGHPEPAPEPPAPRVRVRINSQPNPDLDKGMEKIEEEWRPIRNWEAFYEISNRGEVRSLNRTLKTTGAKWKSRPLRPSLARGRHLRVVFSDGPRKEYVYIHELVRDMFVGPVTGQKEA